MARRIAISALVAATIGLTFQPTWDNVGHRGPLTVYDSVERVTGTDPTYDSILFLRGIEQGLVAGDITFRNCHFSNFAAYLLNNLYDEVPEPTFNVTVIDCTFEGGFNAAGIFGGTGNWTFIRCRFRDGMQDFIKTNGEGSLTCQQCFFGGLSRRPGPGETNTHADGGQLRSNGPILFEECTFWLWASSDPNAGEITPGSFLKQTAIDFNVAEPHRYKCSIGLFFASGSAVVTIRKCFCYAIGNNGFQIQAPDFTGSVTVSDTVFFPDNIRVTHLGPVQDGGGNVWGGTGTTLQGLAVSQGQSVAF